MNPTDSNATNSSFTDPNANTPNFTNSPVPNGGNPEPNAINPPTNPNAGNVGGIDPDTGTVVLPQATGAADTSLTAPNGIQPSTTSISIAGSGPSSDSRKAIIIASALSGAVAVILVMVVIYVVYRRRNKRRESNKTTSVAALSESKFDRSEHPGSDATWVGTRIPQPEDSFNEATLEAGGRVYRTRSFDV